MSDIAEVDAGGRDTDLHVDVGDAGGRGTDLHIDVGDVGGRETDANIEKLMSTSVFGCWTSKNRPLTSAKQRQLPTNGYLPPGCKSV